MHTINLKIDDSIFDKFMGLIEILPQEKISVSEELDDGCISFEEAKTKVQSAINNLPKNEGIDIDKAFDEVLKA